MCPAIKTLFFQCKKLKEAGKIVHYAFGNGSLRIRVNKGDARKHTIAHISDLTKATGISKNDIETIASGGRIDSIVSPVTPNSSVPDAPTPVGSSS